MCKIPVKILMVLFSCVFCMSVYSEAKSTEGLVYDRTYYYDYDDLKKSILPLYVHEDSVVIADVKNLKHNVKGTLIPRFDIVIDKELADRVLAENAELNTDDILPTFYHIAYLWGFDLEGEGDGCSAKIREVAPHGYIKSWSWGKNYVEGITAKIQFYNASKKTIKYITFYLTFDNAVGDPCYGMRGNRTISFEGIGPIREGEVGSWECDEYDPLDYVRNAHTGNLNKCVIEYTDGTKYTLIKELIFGD